MLTYVINTSENKSFNSEKLFELAGYKKIRWISCPLNEIKSCAESIYEKQNILCADQFRIAVIVDFYAFDRIRQPYGRRGFIEDNGVDMSLYMPYIEVFLMDNLVEYLERRDLFAADFEIYYVQNEKCEQYDLMDNAHQQLRQILKGSELSHTKTVQVRREVTPEIPPEGRPPKAEEEELGIDDKPVFVVEDEVMEYFRSFRLHCTKKLSLEFRMVDYPYGSEAMTFDEFWGAFRARYARQNGIRRHY